MKTADGIEIEHGMTLWPLHPLPGCEEDPDPEKGGAVVFAIRDHISGELLIHGDESDLTTCYSTKAAAAQARSANAQINGGTPFAESDCSASLPKGDAK